MLLVLLLLALPLLALLLVLSLALLPWLLWQRYRAGSARRRAWSWVLALGWWTSLASTALFAVSVLVAGFFWPAAWSYRSRVYTGLTNGRASIRCSRSCCCRFRRCRAPQLVSNSSSSGN